MPGASLALSQIVVAQVIVRLIDSAHEQESCSGAEGSKWADWAVTAQRKLCLSCACINSALPCMANLTTKCSVITIERQNEGRRLTAPGSKLKVSAWRDLLQ